MELYTAAKNGPTIHPMIHTLSEDVKTKLRHLILWGLATALTLTLWVRFQGLRGDRALDFQLCYIGTLLLSLGLFRLPWSALVGCNAFVCLLAYLDSIKMTYRSEGLQCQDFLYFVGNLKNNASIGAHYPLVATFAISAVLAAIVAPSLAWMLEKRSSPWKHGLIRGYIALVWPMLALAGVMSAWSARFDQPQLRALGDVEYARAGHVALSYAHVYGDVHQNTTSLTRFIQSCFRLDLHIIENQTGAERFQKVLDSCAPENARAVQSKPDIMIVLQESHADLSILGDYMPLDKVPETQHPGWTGVCRTHTFGGATWLDEIGCFSGTYWGDFGPNATYAPYTVAHRLKQTLPRLLRAQGYRTIVVVPEKPGFMNSEIAHRAYGFDEYYPMEVILSQPDWQQIPDATILDYALNLVKSSQDERPVFIAIKTVQNHGPHTYAATGRETSENTPKEWPVQIAIRNFTQNYNKSIKAMHAVREEWLGNTKRQRVIAFYGDHWPSLEGFAITMGDTREPKLHAESYYETPCSIWSNFPTTLPTRPYLDLAFLGCSILEAGQVELNTMWQANRALREATGGLYVRYPDQRLIEDYLSYCRLHADAWE